MQTFIHCIYIHVNQPTSVPSTEWSYMYLLGCVTGIIHGRQEATVK